MARSGWAGPPRPHLGLPACPPNRCPTRSTACAGCCWTSACWCGRSGPAAAAGPQPRWRRAELRYVDLKAGRRLQVTAYDETQAHTANHEAAEAAAAVDALLGEPFGNWHVDTVEETLQLRVTKKGEAMVHVSAREGGPTSSTNRKQDMTG